MSRYGITLPGALEFETLSGTVESLEAYIRDAFHRSEQNTWAMDMRALTTRWIDRLILCTLLMSLTLCFCLLRFSLGSAVRALMVLGILGIASNCLCFGFFAFVRAAISYWRQIDLVCWNTCNKRESCYLTKMYQCFPSFFQQCCPNLLSILRDPRPSDVSLPPPELTVSLVSCAGAAGCYGRIQITPSTGFIEHAPEVPTTQDNLPATQDDPSPPYPTTHILERDCAAGPGILLVALQPLPHDVPPTHSPGQDPPAGTPLITEERTPQPTPAVRTPGCCAAVPAQAGRGWAVLHSGFYPTGRNLLWHWWYGHALGSTLQALPRGTAVALAVSGSAVPGTGSTSSAWAPFWRPHWRVLGSRGRSTSARRLCLPDRKGPRRWRRPGKAFVRYGQRRGCGAPSRGKRGREGGEGRIDRRGWF